MAAASVRATALAGRISRLEQQAKSTAAPRLADSLRREDVALIAEIKRSSPSRGSISPDMDAAAQASAYERGGAAAISVLTEPDRFDGSDADLVTAARISTLPILKKDFHVEAVQLYHARAIGASAALLIVRAISPEHFRELVAAAESVALELVAEVRDLWELDLALEAGCRIIGVNNRNLETLVIDPRTAETVIPRIPRDRIAIAESGYANRESISGVASVGADAVLVGSFVSASAAPEQAVRNLSGVRRVERGD